MVTGPIKKFDDIFSPVDTMHQRARQTDGQRDGRTDTGRQQRPRLRIASCGKIIKIELFTNEMGAANASSLAMASIPEDGGRSPNFFWSGEDTNIDVLQSLCLLCAFVDIVLL